MVVLVVLLAFTLKLFWEANWGDPNKLNSPSNQTAFLVLMFAIIFSLLIFKPKGAYGWLNNAYSVPPFVRRFFKLLASLFLITVLTVVGTVVYLSSASDEKSNNEKLKIESVNSVKQQPAAANANCNASNLALEQEPQLESLEIRGFDRIEMKRATAAQLDDAFQWKTVIQSEPHATDQGRAYLSLIPAGSRGTPTIWNLKTDKFMLVEQPGVVAEAKGKAVRVADLGSFHGGLAPASVEFEPEATDAAGACKGVPTKKYLWGYVDTDGKWVIAPRYIEAGSFVGEVAIVAVSPGKFQLIDRSGKELTWPHTENRHIPYGATLGNIKLVRAGKWIWINHAPQWSMSAEGEGTGEATYISDGQKLVPLPGVNPTYSPDGELWLLHTAEGPRLWSPANGFVNLPENLIPLQPISKNLFTSNSRTSQSTALYSLDGKLVADPAPIFKVLTSTRFIACESGVSNSLYNWTELGRNVGPDLPGHRCGILNEKGEWWAKPVHQMIDRWGENEVRLQSGGNACIVDMNESLAPDCATINSATTLVPLLDINSFPRRYAYQKGDRRVVTPYQYMIAYPFIGQVAQAVDETGFPGLIDQSGQWLTPRPGGQILAEVHLRAAIVQSPYRNRAPAGTGLIDRNGKWVLPPVFQSIGRYADGSLQACQHVLMYLGSCMHLDVTGKLLLPVTEHTLDSMGWKQEAGATAKNSSLTDPVSKPAGKPQLIAVAVNGVWGYQNDEGRWIIKPRFDDAENFVDDRAPAAMLERADGKNQEGSAQGKQNMPDNAAEDSGQLRWGVINTAGKWIVEPRFEAVSTEKNGVTVAKEGGLYGLLDDSGKWLSEPEFKSIGGFEDGHATAVQEDGTQCKVGIDGKCSGTFTGQIVFQTGDVYVVAKQKIGNEGEQYGYLGQNGEWVIPPKYLQASPFVGDYAAAKDKLPEVPDELSKLWVSTAVQPLVKARLYAVKAEKTGTQTGKTGRFALVDDAGRWLVPVRKSWLDSLPVWSNKN